ncbi:MAG TPA: hypothetical protein VF690_12980 [Hymenobacter sp.]
MPTPKVPTITPRVKNLFNLGLTDDVNDDHAQLVLVSDFINELPDSVTTAGVSQEAFDQAVAGLTETDGQLFQNIGAVDAFFNAHRNNTSNPHATTKAQVGLGNVDNTADTVKPVSTVQKTYIDSNVNDVRGETMAHVADLNNPHATTKTQVGLSNADNTSDANKPVSTAQAAAIYGTQPTGTAISFTANALFQFASGSFTVNTTGRVAGATVEVTLAAGATKPAALSSAPFVIAPSASTDDTTKERHIIMHVIKDLRILTSITALS